MILLLLFLRANRGVLSLVLRQSCFEGGISCLFCKSGKSLITNKDQIAIPKSNAFKAISPLIYIPDQSWVIISGVN
jgi:hypothetical protein